MADLTDCSVFKVKSSIRELMNFRRNLLIGSFTAAGISCFFFFAFFKSVLGPDVRGAFSLQLGKDLKMPCPCQQLNSEKL